MSNQGLAASALVLAFGTISQLIARGVVSTAQVREMIEHSAQLLEELGLDDETSRVAHDNLEMIAAIFPFSLSSKPET